MQADERSQSTEQIPKPSDLTGDGGVLKTVTTPGEGKLPRRGATVQVLYKGTLADTGEVFDETKDGQPFVFTLGEGEVITGWEVAVSAMKIGEKASILCAAPYAYGTFGKDDVVPPDTALRFEMELLGEASRPSPVAAEPMSAADAYTGQASSPANIPQRASMADLSRPDIARTPAEIAAAYEAKMAKSTPSTAPEGGSLVSAIIDRFRTAYIFGLFDSQTGEKAPWYLNPFITFPGMFAFVSLGIILVKVTGAVKLGVPGEVEVPLF